MAELKTKKSNDPVEVFLDSIENEKKRADSYKILEMIRNISYLEPKM